MLNETMHDAALATLREDLRDAELVTLEPGATYDQETSLVCPTYLSPPLTQHSILKHFSSAQPITGLTCQACSCLV